MSKKRDCVCGHGHGSHYAYAHEPDGSAAPCRSWNCDCPNYRSLVHERDEDAYLELTDDELRESTILYMALDGAMCDRLSAEQAVDHARKIYKATTADGSDEWKNRRHFGDCINEPNTCLTCEVEEAERRVQEIYAGE